MPSNRDLFLNPITHDLEIKSFDLSIVDRADSIRQRLKVRLKLFFKEWRLDLSAGVPYYEEVFRKAPNIQVVEALLKTAIKTTPKVLELTSFDLDFDAANRRLFLSFAVRTEEGDISFNALTLQ